MQSQLDQLCRQRWSQEDAAVNFWEPYHELALKVCSSCCSSVYTRSVLSFAPSAMSSMRPYFSNGSPKYASLPSACLYAHVCPASPMNEQSPAPVNTHAVNFLRCTIDVTTSAVNLCICLGCRLWAAAGTTLMVVALVSYVFSSPKSLVFTNKVSSCQAYKPQLWHYPPTCLWPEASSSPDWLESFAVERLPCSRLCAPHRVISLLVKLVVASRRANGVFRKRTCRVTKSFRILRTRQ